MRALVTGSTVLLGNNLVRILINAGHENLGPTATISTPVYQGPISFTATALQLTFRSSPTSAEFMAWRLQTSPMYRIGRGRDSRPPSPDSPRINTWRG